MSNKAIVSQAYENFKGQHPQLLIPLQNGHRHILAGAVELVGPGDYLVWDEGKGQEFEVRFHSGELPTHGWHCNCREIGPKVDFWGSVGHRICSHIAAAGIMEQASGAPLGAWTGDVAQAEEKSQVRTVAEQKALAEAALGGALRYQGHKGLYSGASGVIRKWVNYGR